MHSSGTISFTGRTLLHMVNK